jgi:hypothetical protein
MPSYLLSTNMMEVSAHISTLSAWPPTQALAFLQISFAHPQVKRSANISIQKAIHNGTKRNHRATDIDQRQLAMSLLKTLTVYAGNFSFAQFAETKAGKQMWDTHDYLQAVSVFWQMHMFLADNCVC